MNDARFSNVNTGRDGHWIKKVSPKETSQRRFLRPDHLHTFCGALMPSLQNTSTVGII